MELDGHTLLVSGLAMRASYALVFLAMWLRDRGDLYLRDWGLSATLIAAGFLVVLMNGAPEEYLGAARGFLAYGLFGLGLTLLWVGLRRFDRRPIPPGLVAVSALAAPVAYVGVLVASGTEGLAFAAAFVGFSVGCLVFVGDLLSPPDRRRLASRIVAAGAFLVYVAGFVAAAMLSLAEAGPDQPPVSSEVLALALDQICSLFCNVALLALAGERARSELEWLATRDPLTGLLNRRGLLLAASRHLADPSPERPPLAVLVADIDAFKLVNDSHGHDTGDAVLMRFATIARGILGDRDLVARYGGEEFTGVLPGSDLEAARRLAERLRHAVEREPFSAGDIPLGLTVSIGIATVGPGEESILPAVARADAALYVAKQSGRNRVVA